MSHWQMRRCSSSCQAVWGHPLGLTPRSSGGHPESMFRQFRCASSQSRRRAKSSRNARSCCKRFCRFGPDDSHSLAANGQGALDISLVPPDGQRRVAWPPASTILSAVGEALRAFAPATPLGAPPQGTPWPRISQALTDWHNARRRSCQTPNLSERGSCRQAPSL